MRLPASGNQQHLGLCQFPSAQTHSDSYHLPICVKKKPSLIVHARLLLEANACICVNKCNIHTDVHKAEKPQCFFQNVIYLRN